MAISVSCPSCGREYNVKDDAAGKKFQCKDCDAVVEVPEAAPPTDDEDYGDPFGLSDEDPFGDTSTLSPPQSRRPKSRSSGSKASAKQRTMLPAVFIYVVSGLSMLYWIVNAGGHLMGVEAPAMFQNQQQFGPEAQMILGIIVSGVFFIREIFIIFAARKLQVCESYGVAMAGAILCVVPCVGSPCCILGIPFGIWALVVLNNADVKAAFS